MRTLRQIFLASLSFESTSIAIRLSRSAAQLVPVSSMRMPLYIYIYMYYYNNCWVTRDKAQGQTFLQGVQQKFHAQRQFTGTFAESRGRTAEATKVVRALSKKICHSSAARYTFTHAYRRTTGQLRPVSKNIFIRAGYEKTSTSSHWREALPMQTRKLYLFFDSTIPSSIRCFYFL